MSSPSGSPIHLAHLPQPQIPPIPRCHHFLLPPSPGRRVQKSSSMHSASSGGSARLSKSSSAKTLRLFRNLTLSFYGALFMPSITISTEASLGSCKPHQAQTILGQNGMGEALNGKLLISILAGITISQLTTWVPPTTKVVRAMPNTPCRVRDALPTMLRPNEIRRFERA